jgi:Zn-dependent protease/CBS domain-containing protein
MKWAWTLGTVAGTKVRIHVTFLILLAFLAVNFWSTSGPRAALVGVAFFVALFLCVVLHEFGHALAARRYGIRTPDITLYPIGGIARLERIPKTPMHELVVAVAGPLVNVFIAALLFLLLGGLPPVEALVDFGSMTWTSFLARLMLVNVMLVVFNLIPAFPMDGGRMLRAVLAMIVPRPRATRWAATIGQMLAVAGALVAISTNWWWLLIIAAFVFFAAGQEAAMIDTQAAFEGVAVEAAMESRFQVLKNDDTLARAAEVLLEGQQHDFPVIDESGVCSGILLRNDLLRALANGKLEVSVGATAQAEFVTLAGDQPLMSALESLSASGLPVAPVMDSNGQIKGLLTRENVAEFLVVRGALPQSKTA